MNRLKLGDKVVLTSKAHKWHVDYLVEGFTIHNKIPERHWKDVVCILGSKVMKVPLKGKVTGYGANDEEYKDNRNFVKVNFSWRNFNTWGYFSEKDVRKVK